MNRYLWIFVTPLIAGAQVASIEVTAPTLGYVWEDQSQRLRTIQGVPGAATLGNSLNLDGAFERLSVSPGRRYALGAVPGATNLTMVRLDGSVGAAFRSELPVGAISFSPAGTAVALSLGSRIEVWTGLPDRPARSGSFVLDDLGVDRTFVSDDGNLVLALSGTSLWKLTADAPAELLGDGYRDVAFLENSQDLLAANSQGVSLLRKAILESAEPIEGSPSSALAIAVSADERSVAVLVDGALALFNRDSGKWSQVSLDGITAGALIRAQGNAVFQLTAKADDDIWMVDADSGSLRLFSVSKGENQ